MLLRQIFRFPKYNNLSILRVYSTNENIEENLENSKIDEEKLKVIRNKSRLNPNHQNMIHNKEPYPKPATEFHDSVQYKRRMYGHYGSEVTNFNIASCWPDRATLKENIEFENFKYPYTIQELRDTISKKNEEEKNQKLQREKEILEKMSHLEQMKENLKAKIQKREAGAYATLLRKERLIEEIRKEFGFKISVKDARFKEALEKREKAEKKLLKEEKKKKKEAKFAERITNQVMNLKLEE